MNIVLLSDTGVVNGGAAQVALDDARELARAGYKVHLVCGAGPVAQDLIEQPNLTVHAIGAMDVLEDPNRLRGAANGWWNPQVRKRMGELMDGMDRQDTVVHIHSWTKALSSSAVRAALDRGFKSVMTVHDFLLACPTGTLFLQNKLEKCTLRPMSAACICTNCDVRSYPQKLYRVGRRFIQNQFGHIPRGLKHFIFYSEFAKELLRPYLPKDAVFHPVPNWIEMDRKPPADVTASETFLSMGRLTPEKGVELFARAAAAAGAACRFVGEGMSRENILRSNPNAVLSGWLSHKEGLQALREARALVFPSLWYETLGLVVLEAAGNGVPSIVPDTCAARESVVDGVTGLYFKSGDEADLRAKINMLKDPAVASRMGKAAYKRLWDSPRWGLDAHLQELGNAYESILDGSVARPQELKVL